MKILKGIGIGIGIGIAGVLVLIIIWMNITPGYFQYDMRICNDDFIYIQDKDNLPPKMNGHTTYLQCRDYFPEKTIIPRTLNTIKNFLSKADFNR